MEAIVLWLFTLAMITLAGGLWRLQQEVGSKTLTGIHSQRGTNRAGARRVQSVAANDFC